MVTVGSNFTNEDLKGGNNNNRDTNQDALNIIRDVATNVSTDNKLKDLQSRDMVIPNLGDLSSWEKDFLAFFNAGANSNTASRWADQNNQARIDAHNDQLVNTFNSGSSDLKADLGFLKENPDDAKWYEAPTAGVDSILSNSPMTQLLKNIFGVDELTGSFEVGRAEQNDPHGDSAKLMALAQSGMLGGTGGGTSGGYGGTSGSLMNPTTPPPSPNPEGLYIRPNMLNQVPDNEHYSQAFKDANQAYMQNVAFRPSDFGEKIDLRAFEKLQGLLYA